MLLDRARKQGGMSFVQKLIAVGDDPRMPAQRRRALVAHSLCAPQGARPPGAHPDPGGVVFVYDPEVPGERARAIAAATAWIGAEEAVGRAVDFLFVEVDPDR